MSSRTEIPTAGLGPGVYPLLTSLVVPRPIAWVSTRSAAGADNLAPHSFFTVASAVPPVVSFTSVGDKDTLRNCRETGEFVVGMATEAMRERVNDTATDFPADASEFTAAGLTPEPSAVVRPARVRESPMAMECRVVDERTFGEGPGASTVVFGEVVHIAVDPAMVTDGLPDVALMRPMARLNRDLWSTLGDLVDLRRVPHDEWLARHGSGPPESR